MGYCIELLKHDFTIKKENAEQVVNALKVFSKNYKGKYSNDIMWVDKKALINSESIEESLDEIRYPVITDDNGDYILDYFRGEKLGNDHEIFNSISKYVVPNSFIEFEGEDGDVFKFIFDGEKCDYKFLYNTYDNNEQNE